MLRLAGVRPLIKAFGLAGRPNVGPRVFFQRAFVSDSPQQTQQKDAMDKILQQIQVQGTAVTSEEKKNLVPQYPGGEAEEQEVEVPEEGQQFSTAKKYFKDAHYTTQAYQQVYEEYPILKHDVDKNKIDKRLQYEAVYLANHAYEPKKVFVCKNLVTKNYRTMVRSWPMVHLNSFKFGNDHFLDEMYDDIKGKKRFNWANQLAYPDGTINLFCGTSAKASPLDVKGDATALTYDESLYKSETPKPIRLTVSKGEADAKYPHRRQASEVDEEVDKPIRRPRPTRPKPRLDETEEEEDARLAREYAEDNAARLKREQRAELRVAKEVEEQATKVGKKETRTEREARWARELEALKNLPWRTLYNQTRKEWDERVIFDPVTMVKVISTTSSGKMVERYYYKDDLNEENVYVGSHFFDTLIPRGERHDLEPGYNPTTGVLENAHDHDSLELAPSSLPQSEDELYYPNFPPTLERNAHKVINQLVNPREEGVSVSSSTPNATATLSGLEGLEFEQKELRTDLLEESVLPAELREVMVSSFKELVKENKLRAKSEDEVKYYNDYVRMVAKAIGRAKEEEYSLNERLDEIDNNTVRFPGMVEVLPTYYFRYIKLNLKDGWIRFYVGEQDRAGKDLETQLSEESQVLTDDHNVMKFPFVWKYSEYKIPKEELKSMRSVKWPPSLVPPPTSANQVGDGSPQDQLAQYFEDSYLRFGNLLRFRPDSCYSDKHDGLSNFEAKVNAYEQVDAEIGALPDPGPLNLEDVRNADGELLSAEDRTELETRLRSAILRDAQNAIQAKLQRDADLEAVEAEEGREAWDETEREIEYELAGESVLHAYSTVASSVPEPEISAERVGGVPLPQRFQQRGKSVIAFDPSGARVIQEYVGYRLKVVRNKVRIIRVQADAEVRFYNPETGELVNVEYHNDPMVFHSAAPPSENADERIRDLEDKKERFQRKFNFGQAPFANKEREIDMWKEVTEAKDRGLLAVGVNPFSAADEASSQDIDAVLAALNESEPDTQQSTSQQTTTQQKTETTTKDAKEGDKHQITDELLKDILGKK